MIHCNFNLKSVKQKPHLKERPINLIARWHGRKLAYSTLEKIEPEHFETDPSKRNFQRAKHSHIGYSELNRRLDYLENASKDVFHSFINDNHRIPEPHELKKIFDVKLRFIPEQKRLTFFQFVDQFIKEAEKSGISLENGRKKSKGTIRIYKNTQRRLKEFEQYYGRKIEFETVDLDFYDKWIEFLSEELQLALNSIGRYTKTVRVFMQAATEKNLNTNMVFKSKRFKILGESVYKIYLNEKELTDMFNLDLTNNKKLERVRDLYICTSYTGLRYADIVSIKKENIKGDKFQIKTKKTGEVIMLPIHPRIKSIMKRYTDYPNSLPPGISNVKFNRYIKLVGALIPSLQKTIQVSITRGGKVITETIPKFKAITIHTARRSFISNLYLEGMDSLQISKMTGHRNFKSFMLYIKVTMEENAELLEAHWKKKELTKTEQINEQQ